MGPLLKFASSWLKTVGNVIDFRHDVVVKVQVCDAKSRPFLLREIHFGGQGALKAVRHQRIVMSDQVGGNVECLMSRLP